MERLLTVPLSFRKRAMCHKRWWKIDTEPQLSGTVYKWFCFETKTSNDRDYCSPIVPLIRRSTTIPNKTKDEIKQTINHSFFPFLISFLSFCRKSFDRRWLINRWLTDKKYLAACQEREFGLITQSPHPWTQWQVNLNTNTMTALVSCQIKIIIFSSNLECVVTSKTRMTPWARR